MPQRLRRVKAIIQPAAYELQFAVDAGFGGAEQIGGFFGGESEEKTQLHHAALARIQLLEFGENAIEVDDFRLFGVHPGKLFIQRDRNAAVALPPSLRARVIHQNAAHQTG